MPMDMDLSKRWAEMVGFGALWLHGKDELKPVHQMWAQIITYMMNPIT